MKKNRFLIGIFFILFSMVSFGNIRIMNENLEERRDNLIFINGEEKPYTGILVKNFLDGEIIGRLEIVNGLYDGELAFYHENGPLFSKFKVNKGHFQDGSAKLYGKKGLTIGRITFRNGKMVEQVRYEGGKVITQKNNYTLEEVIYEKNSMSN